MGRDKAALRVGGMTILERMARTALAVSPEVVVVGRERPGDWPGELGVRFLRDDDMGGSAAGGRGEGSGGPVVGLVTAVRHVEGRVLVLACDLPLMTSGLLRDLAAAHREGNLATMAETGRGAEPLCAVYEPGLLPVLEGMVREQRRALYPLAALPGVGKFRVPGEREWELLNVNTVEDLAEAERIVEQQGRRQQ